jgi:hypothetical protein
MEEYEENEEEFSNEENDDFLDDTITDYRFSLLLFKYELEQIRPYDDYYDY